MEVDIYSWPPPVNSLLLPFLIALLQAHFDNICTVALWHSWFGLLFTSYPWGSGRGNWKHVRGVEDWRSLKMAAVLHASFCISERSNCFGI